MEKLRQGDPESIGPYSIIARLGAGGMGVVFLATRGAERVALKVVRSSFLDDPSLRTRFEREIETLKKVSSPFVAKIIDSSIEGEIAWHAVEFGGKSRSARRQNLAPMRPRPTGYLPECSHRPSRYGTGPHNRFGGSHRE